MAELLLSNILKRNSFVVHSGFVFLSSYGGVVVAERMNNRAIELCKPAIDKNLEIL
tara:strand:+ start:899 stop:1066 length:168 start_codon:yes stop_codon:yes gene_type:complete